MIPTQAIETRHPFVPPNLIVHARMPKKNSTHFLLRSLSGIADVKSCTIDEDMVFIRLGMRYQSASLILIACCLSVGRMGCSRKLLSLDSYINF
mmetsp:Transcript_46665/g.68989  ORF Transcript_46665/g.68989 Transcript_46665/m.68989 type:complete len:94 (-) Transcript_46665:31-312(-)